AAAGPEVDDLPAARRPLDRHFDEQLRLRPRNEHAVVDVELARVELGLAADVLQRLAGVAALQIRLHARRIELDLAVRVKPRDRAGEEIGEQHVDVAWVDAALERVLPQPRAQVVEALSRHTSARGTHPPARFPSST